ncbi:hypothetical protein [Amorphus sp. MBR-141]
MIADIAIAFSFFFTGLAASYCLRMFKRRTRYLVNYREFIQETPEELQRMIERLRMENRLLRGRIEVLEGREVRRRPVERGNHTPTTVAVAHSAKPRKK